MTARTVHEALLPAVPDPAVLRSPAVLAGRLTAAATGRTGVAGCAGMCHVSRCWGLQETLSQLHGCAEHVDNQISFCRCLLSERALQETVPSAGQLEQLCADI